MKLIVIDPGHGGSDPGATYQTYKEKNFNFLISSMVRDRLLSKYDVKVVLTRDSDKTLTLKERTDLANALKPDFFLSIHNNAAGGSGFESYIYNGTIPKETVQLQATIHDRIANSVLKKYQVLNRGRKRANFHVLRETNMSALLIEVLFVDNASDLKLLTNPAFITDMSTSIADATAVAMNLPLKPAPPEGSLYKVIAGSFSKRELADDQLNRLIQKGFNAFVASAVVNGQTVYRVQAGAFKEMENAEALVERLNKTGFETFILIETIAPPEEPPKPEPEPDKGHPIEGSTILTAAQMNAYVRSVNPKAPALGALYLSHSKRYGISGDIAFAQAIHETNFFRFTGDVKPEQNNFAGIGATGGGAAGASFPDASTGVTAQLQHLYAYASTKPLPDGDKLVDPRFSLVQRGSATTWQALNGKWAVPGTTYGQLILKHYERMLEFSINELVKQQGTLQSTKDNLEIEI
ncbi:N-acetylmuramoyl-L-alanine amidase [Alkalihalobacillus macyae]|uniref:N-acetylmuramoyl-L-alanine amidase n=1 Tax=Guptibacillus hwajinpoensis TaxID=208199 RepID=UPI00273C7C9B|nr:N-acetylmuramoyl-L-alanine amidase [Alkalihalobacillus macyae]MDP4552367.1 N-acetylmuramoyl-L-alanine amidase [Alkalihalobacillus macyae]